MDCEFCGKQFSTKGNLGKHQQTAKYCIELQKKGEPKTFICNGCGKSLSNNYRLNTHRQVCEKYLEDDKIQQLQRIIEQSNMIISMKDTTINELKDKIRELELDMKDIALKSKGKTTTNNGNTYVYQNFTPITDEKLKEDAINFTKEHLVLGGQGVARFALENTLKDNFVCTDASRGHVKYMDSSGDMVFDPYSHSIARRVCSSIVEPAEKINLDVKNTLSGQTPDTELIRAVLIDETSKEIRHAADGLENELTREFIKTISSSSVKKVEV